MYSSTAQTIPTVMVFGATGMTGRFVVHQLLDLNYYVKIIVRSPEKLNESILQHPNLFIIRASLFDLSEEALREHMKGVSAVVQCLGHTLDLQGIFGKPHDLCTGMVQRVHSIASKRSERTKFILMNTVGVQNPSLVETRNWGDNLLLFLLRYLLPPHADNENALNYLYLNANNTDERFEWVIVRPDLLIDGESVTTYDLLPSPLTAILKGRNTSRINVANFMVNLVDDQSLWNEWKFRMPVLMDAVDGSSPGSLKEEM